MSTKTIERGMWTEDEHDKFLVGLKMYPKGPWKLIAAEVGTRSSRQVQTHAQKYYEKVARRMRGLRKDRKKLVRPEHRLGDDMMALCKISGSDEAVEVHIDPIRRCTKTAAVSPTSVDTASEGIGGEDEVSTEGDDGHPGSFVSLLTEHGDDCDAVFGEVSDSDDMDSLMDLDDSYVDFLLGVLEPNAGDGSCSE